MKLKKIPGILFRIGFIALSVLASFLVYISVNDYRPSDVTKLEVYGPAKEVRIDTNVFSFLTWNIGYGGLGKEMDFFYDGGKQVRPDQETFDKYWMGITEYLKEIDTIDFVLLQEIDVRSKRSYFINEKQEISDLFPDHYEIFATNYDVKVVPVPLLNPLGKVNAGLMTLSRYTPVAAERIAFPNLAGWPQKLFLLDRCMILVKIPLPNNKDLVVVNTHNSFYIKEDSLRQVELDILKDFVLKEYQKGNYVIAGGDWNQNPHDLNITEFDGGDKFSPTHIKLDHDFMPDDWTWIFDPGTPTSRNIDVVYQKGSTPATIIDFYLLSPNLEALEINTLSMDFEFTDHNPVYMKVGLKE